jgi:hypothetical protein
MNDEKYYSARDDRLFRYPEARMLDQSKWIVITAGEEYLQTYAGQVALLTAANLLGRMSRRVAIDIPAIAMHINMPWAGADLADHALTQMQCADPRGEFGSKAFQSDDHRVHLGASGAQVVTHGTCWLAYHGPSPSPLKDSEEANPIGAALAVIAMASRLAANGFDDQGGATCLNAYSWTHDIDGLQPSLPENVDLGSVWTVGTGSVGTAILYFLSLATRQFEVALFDGDKVKRENITRSPVFAESDIGQNKAEVTAGHLEECGVRKVSFDPKMLHESAAWLKRECGTPDLLVSAANEHNVRSRIEALMPPVQIYGTTGKNWQALAVRHVPMVDACSCCLFPETDFAPTECATDGEIATKDKEVDASLPHLSFAAGLMATAEILKLTISEYAMQANRVLLYTKPDLRLIPAKVRLEPDCMCQKRSTSTHVRMVEGSRYARLSDVRVSS